MSDMDMGHSAQEAPRNGATRRGFIKGVIAAAPPPPAPTSSGRNAGQPAAGAAERLVTLKVNGQSRRVDVLRRKQLAMTLRYKLGLTGTKLGCDRAECGACTVLLDGVPHYSCSLLTQQVRGREVTTIEGLESARRQAPSGAAGGVGRAGFQCAFCLPGSSWRWWRPSRRTPTARARRCATARRQPVPLRRLQQDPEQRDARRRVRRRAATLATRRPDSWPRTIGTNYTPPDHYAKVTGRARYAED